MSTPSRVYHLSLVIKENEGIYPCGVCDENSCPDSTYAGVALTIWSVYNRRLSWGILTHYRGILPHKQIVLNAGLTLQRIPLNFAFAVQISRI